MAKRYSISVRPLARVAMVIVALVVVLTAQGAQAQCPSNDLTPCLEAARNGAQPTAECCTNLQAYFDTTLGEVCPCFEAALLPVFQSGLVNPVFALELPEKCNLRFTAGTSCAGFVIPGGQ